MTEWTRYVVRGVNPEPWKAAEGSLGRKGGKVYIHFTSPESLRFFKESFAEEFKRQNPSYEMLTGKLEIVFYVSRNVAEYETELGHKGSANYADSTNMLKALEDSLQDVLYENDQGNVEVRLRQVQQGPYAEPCVVIFVRPDQGTPPAIWEIMLEEQPEPTSKNILPKERGADGLF